MASEQGAPSPRRRRSRPLQSSPTTQLPRPPATTDEAFSYRAERSSTDTHPDIRLYAHSLTSQATYVCQAERLWLFRTERYSANGQSAVRRPVTRGLW